MISIVNYRHAKTLLLYRLVKTLIPSCKAAAQGYLRDSLYFIFSLVSIPPSLWLTLSLALPVNPR